VLQAISKLCISIGASSIVYIKRKGLFISQMSDEMSDEKISIQGTRKKNE
jgi:hypothetical protein